MVFEFGVRYETEDGKAASLIAEVVKGRLAPVFLRLYFRGEGSTVVSLEEAHPASDSIDFKDWSGHEIEGFPCHRIEAVMLEDPFQPIDRSDELRGGE